MENKISNEQIDIYYNTKKKERFARSFSFSSGFIKANTKPRTISNKINYDLIYNEKDYLKNNDIIKESDNEDSFSEDEFLSNLRLKERNYSITNGNLKEALAYREGFPKKVGSSRLSIVNDGYEDLTKVEHESIVNEMRHFYISFTSRLDINNDNENEMIEISHEFNNNNDNINNNTFITSINHSFNEGISFKTVPLISPNSIYTIGNMDYEIPKSSEELLKQIYDNKTSNIDNNDNDYNDNVNINDDNNNIENNNKESVNIVDIDDKNEKDISSSSTSFNESSVPIPQRRRSSLFQFLFKSKSKNSSYVSSPQIYSHNNESSVSINGDTSNIKMNHENSNSKSVINGRGSSSSILYNDDSVFALHSSYASSVNHDINDILNIGINVPILEEEPVTIVENSSSKPKDKKRNSKLKRKSSSYIEHDLDELNEVFKNPDIELIGRKSFENNVISMFLAEKIRKILPPYYRECQNWELVYSLIDHGSSLTTLLQNCEETELTGSFILGILDSEGYIFGAYLSENIHVSKRFYGSGECFLWRYNKQTEEIEYYRGSSENQYHIVTDKSFIAFGGGNGEFGLYISSDLINGYTTNCPTYNNQPLTPNSKFECVNIELWGFNFKV